jgi:hypothetical protein
VCEKYEQHRDFVDVRVDGGGLVRGRLSVFACCGGCHWPISARENMRYLSNFNCCVYIWMHIHSVITTDVSPDLGELAESLGDARVKTTTLCNG